MFLFIISYMFSCVYYIISFLFTFISTLHAVLPLGLDVGLFGVAAYYLTRLRGPEQGDVESIFGPEPGSKDAEMFPERVVKGIAHRGAGWDAPENTLEAFRYCVESECNFVELDVRSTRDGQLVLLHDQGLERLTWSSEIKDVRQSDWESIKHIDVGALHVNRHRFKEVHLCLLDEAVEYLLSKNAKMIIDIKGQDKEVINGVLEAFSSRPLLYKHAVVTTFNPYVLYQIRKKDPQIVGAISYRPYCFSAKEYDAENGPRHPRYDNLLYHMACRVLDIVHSLLWRYSARWCSASAVLVHKDIVAPCEVSYWRSLGVRCIGWSVNRPLEKLYWRGGLKAPYLANTLLGEPKVEHKKDHQTEDLSGPIVENAARSR